MKKRFLLSSIMVTLLCVGIAFLFMNLTNHLYDALIGLTMSVLLAAIIVFAGCWFYGRPVGELQDYMRRAGEGEFVHLPMVEPTPDEVPTLDDITQMRFFYNQMVWAVEDLVGQVKIEGKKLAQNELRLLEAQINPHFLYNTLDAVTALALLGDNENCLKMTQALGNFYRNSLNSGREFITVEDEINCIDNYIKILNIRYDNKITMDYDIEENIKKEKILKLILQPIVENAAHHGIRNKEEDGTIAIKGYLDEDEIIFIVTDDGIGMNEDKVEDILAGRANRSQSGFGLYSSIQRISLYYGIENPITITSEIGNGTEISIRTKVWKGGSPGEA